MITETLLSLPLDDIKPELKELRKAVLFLKSRGYKYAAEIIEEKINYIEIYTFAYDYDKYFCSDLHPEHE